MNNMIPRSTVASAHDWRECVGLAALTGRVDGHEARLDAHHTLMSRMDDTLTWLLRTAIAGLVTLCVGVVLLLVKGG